jgi:hypothetical protein
MPKETQLNREVYQPILNLIKSSESTSRKNFRANMLVQVATLSLLVEAGITTIDAASERIRKLTNDFSEIFDDKEISSAASWAISMLSGEAPLHGTLIEQSIQRMKKSEVKK